MWFVVKGGWPQMILLFLIMRCTPTIRELIEATPLSPSSPSATSLSALAPAQRAGAQRLCALAQSGHHASRRIQLSTISGLRDHAQTNRIGRSAQMVDLLKTVDRCGNAFHSRLQLEGQKLRIVA